MNRLLAALCVGLICGPAGLPAQSAPPPNVILLMADDLGWADTGFNGSRHALTPELDRMAAAGLNLTRYYAASPVCSPTRGSVLTGRHPHRYGIVHANSGHLPDEEITLAEVLRDRGYSTGFFGKWHLGTLTVDEPDSNRGGPEGIEDYMPPWRQGFERVFATEAKVPTFDPMLRRRDVSRDTWWDPVASPAGAEPYGTAYWREDGTRVSENLRGDDSRVIMDRAIEFISDAANTRRPFLAVIWFHAPHLPVVAGAEHRRPFAHLDPYAQHYFGSILALDEQVGRLRRSLRELGLAENTLVWFSSDNGPEGQADTAPGSAGLLRGRKRDLYEGGIRVPGLVEWPGVVSAGSSSDDPVVSSDVFPTLLEIVGEAPPPGRRLDGESVLPLLRGRSGIRRAPIGFEFQGAAALSDARYKLVRPRHGHGPDDARAGPPPPYELYDVVADPGERVDLAADRPATASRLRAALEEWRSDVRADADDLAHGVLVPIGRGWARSSVNTVIFRQNSLVTHGDTQYAAYYDPEGRMVLASRRLGTRDWRITPTRYTGNVRDAHNSISLAVDGAGVLHVAWDHHGQPLNYARGKAPGSLELTDPLPMTSHRENRVTYPQFYLLPDGDLLFLYRDGASGSGDLLLNRWDAEGASWNVVQHPLISGEGERNPYNKQLAVDDRGGLHLSWTWRETPDVATNHDVLYAYSPDGGRTWQTSDRRVYELPITQATAEIARRVPQGSELINQTSTAVDAQGRPLIATYWRPDGTEVPQFHLVWHDGATWRTSRVGSRTQPFRLSGGGTRRIPISRPLVLADVSGRVHVIFRDEERGGGITLATSEDPARREWRLRQVVAAPVGQWEPTHDPSLWKGRGELHLLHQRVGQGQGETLEDLEPQPVSVLEVRFAPAAGDSRGR